MSHASFSRLVLAIQHDFDQSCDFEAVTWTTLHCPLTYHQVALFFSFRTPEEQTLRLLINSGIKFLETVNLHEIYIQWYMPN